jgi:hypothetical protein
MKAGILVYLAGLSLLPLSAGCAGMYKNRVNQELWERELRLQEDCIYKLKWQLEDTQRALAEANQRLGTANKAADVMRGGPALTLPPSSPGNRGGEAPPALPPAPNLPDVTPGQEFTPGIPSGSSKLPGGSGALSPPMELRGPALSTADSPRTTANPLRTQESRQPPILSGVSSADKLDPETQVDRISLNPSLTGALDRHGNPSSELLSVVIDQRDASDVHVVAPGDVSIVVVDPALEGREAKIARWDFDSEEVAQHVRRNRDGGSLQFELPWPKPPEHSDLRLFVRFTAFDGRKLEANLPIEARLADTKRREWSKSKVALAGHETDDAEAASADAPQQRSVYDRKPDDSESAPPIKEAARTRPAWSPNR